MIPLIVITLAFICYMYATRKAFENDNTWIELAKTHPPTETIQNPIYLALKRGVFRVKIGKNLRNLATQEPMAINLGLQGLVIQQHNYLCRNGGKAVELKWDNITAVKKRYFFRLRIIDLEYKSIDKVISIMCVTNKSEKTLDEILARCAEKGG